MSQGARGETTFVVADREYTIFYNNRALVEAENRIGRGIVGVVQDATQGEIKLGDVAILLHVGLEAARREARVGGYKVTMLDVYSMLDEMGWSNALTSIIEAVTVVLSYDGNAEEPEEPADPND